MHWHWSYATRTVSNWLWVPHGAAISTGNVLRSKLCYQGYLQCCQESTVFHCMDSQNLGIHLALKGNCWCNVSLVSLPLPAEFCRDTQAATKPIPLISTVSLAFSSCARAFIHPFIHMYHIYIYTHTHIHFSIHVYIYIYVYIYIFVYVYIYMDMYIYIYVYIYICIYIYTYD